METSTNLRNWIDQDKIESTLTERVVTIITQMIFCSKREVLLDLKTFCRLIISENRLDKDKGFYSVEFQRVNTKLNESIHWVHYPFGVPESKIKNIKRKMNKIKNREKKEKEEGVKKRSPQRNFHNQCSFYLKMPEGYFVHAMLFPNFKIKLACCKNRERDHRIVAERFISVLQSIIDDSKRFSPDADPRYVYLLNEATHTVEKIQLIDHPDEIGLSKHTTEMCNETFQANYEINLDQFAHLFINKYKMCAIQKDDYSGIIIPMENPKTKNTVHIFVFSSGKMIGNSKYEEDSDYAYEFMKNVIINDREQIEEETVILD